MADESAYLDRELRRNTRHLYLDIAWFGLLSGSAVAFISVYMVRIGASAAQIGLMNAGPALVAMFISIPVGKWLKQHPVDRSVFWASIFFRFFYILWLPLPLLFSSAGQVSLLLAMTLVMSIPGTALTVGFNAMFADAVPPEARGRVVGVRNALLAVTYILTSLLSGYLLDALPFPINYQLVFGLGVLGGLMSSYHLFRIRVSTRQPNGPGRPLGDLAQPGFPRAPGDGLRGGIALRYLTRLTHPRRPRFSVLRSRYGAVLLALFVFHLAQYLAIPLFPIFWIDHLGLSDQEISLGYALFYATVFIGSTQLGRLTDKFGNHGVTFIGVLLMSGYPLLTALTREIWLFIFSAVYGGAAWGLAGGALGNYLLETIPADDRPGHLAWYMVALNAAVLLGSLGGPLLAGWMGMIPALSWIAALRVLSALWIGRLGRSHNVQRMQSERA
jgi:MFS family permease